VKWVAIALLAMMPLHVYLQPEHGWLLLSACDVAMVAMAIGVISNRPRVVAPAFLFSTFIGLPSFAVGLCTTYKFNVTGTILHVVPPVLGGMIVAHNGLPRWAAFHAWLAYVAAFVAAMAIAPAELNINFANTVWPPLANVFGTLGFQAAVLVAAAAVLALGDFVTSRVGRRAVAPQAAS
jgi:hypothetical protein